MKITLTAITIFLIAFGTCSAQNNADSLGKANIIMALEQKLQDGVTNGDKPLWDKYMAADFMIVNEDGSRDNKKSFLDKLDPLPKGFSGELKILSPHVTFRSNFAVVNYVADEYETAYNQDLHTTYGWSDTWELGNNNNWQIVGMQIYEIPALPKPIAADTTLMKQYCGVYYILPDISYTVTFWDGKLFGQRSGGKQEELLPETNDVFFRRSDTRGRRIFVKAADGTWQMLARRNGQDLVWKRKDN